MKHLLAFLLIPLFAFGDTVLIESIEQDKGWIYTDTYISTSDGKTWKVDENETFYLNKWHIGDSVYYLKWNGALDGEFELKSTVNGAGLKIHQLENPKRQT